MKQTTIIATSINTATTDDTAIIVVSFEPFCGPPFPVILVCVPFECKPSAVTEVLSVVGN